MGALSYAQRPETMIAAIYTRVSTDEQAERGLSLDIQEARCRDMAERHGATEICVYQDDGYTSLSLDRPALQRLLADLLRLDRIYVLDQSRWSRDPADLEDLRARLLDANVALIPLSSPLDQTTPHGQFVSRIEVAADRYTVDVSRAKTMASLTELAARGHHHARTPLGYARPRDAGGHIIRDVPLEVVAHEAEIIQRIYQEYAAGQPIAEIQRGLVADGVLSRRRECVWAVSTIARILDNPIYTGRVRYAGEVYDADHRAIVTDRLWRTARARRARESHVRPPSRGTLCPLLRCGVCGGRIQAVGGGREGRNRSYRCRDRQRRPPADRHPALYKSRHAVEACIWAWVADLLSGDVLEGALERLSGMPAPDDRGRFEAELLEVERQVAYNLEAARAGGLPHDMLAEQQGPLLARREELLGTLSAGGDGRLTAGQVRRLRRRGPRLVERLSAQDAGHQRQFLQLLIAHVELHHGGVMIWPAVRGVPRHGVAYPAWRGPHHGWDRPDLSVPWSP